ncbi:hypothetical protein E3J62_05115 [candidate division TA06 bacterium]|uniref:Lambda-carrageenase beta-propeller domain-containing protein n=1 Tax=candidate division TA06 bacterium TaxID=2250710 RepID=A0A523UUC4_UNCT6|nr:MAG: hypothetical protein E3J62_05115 [candidate division TA06 bacterium]
MCPGMEKSAAVVLPLALSFLLTLKVANGASIRPVVAWRYVGPDSLAGAVVAHIRPGPQKQIIQMVKDGPLVALDSRGKTIWKFDLQGTHNCVPAAFDLDGDGKDEIVFEDMTGGIFAIDDDGSRIWQNPEIHQAGDYNSAPAIADVDGDSLLEVIVTTYGGKIACLDAMTGKTEWVFSAEDREESFQGQAAISDIDADGIMEVVAFGYGWGIFVLDGRNGQVKSAFPAMEKWGEGGYATGPAVCDLTGDGLKEMVFQGYWKGLAFALRADMSTYWLYDAYDEISEIFIYASPSIGDIDGDGIVDVVCVGKNAEFLVFAPDGRMRWTMRPGERSNWSPPLVDIDADGIKEILDCATKRFFIIDGKARTQLWHYGRGRGSYLGGEYPAFWPTALVDDIDGDGKVDIYLVDYEAGVGSFIKINTPLRDRWPCYMQNNLRTGFDEPKPESCFLDCSSGPLRKGPLRISFGLNDRSKISMHITDLTGRKVYTYPRGLWEAGTHHLVLRQEGLPKPTLFFCRLVTEQETLIAKMAMIP